MKIRFPERGRSGRFVATLKNLEAGFGDKVGLHILFTSKSATNQCFFFPFLETKKKLFIYKLCILNAPISVVYQVLFSRANLTIEKGEKIAIIGPNGCGKSTLLKIIMGLQKPIAGEVLLGEHNVLPNYFEQNQVCTFINLCLNQLIAWRFWIFLHKLFIAFFFSNLFL